MNDQMKEQINLYLESLGAIVDMSRVHDLTDDRMLPMTMLTIHQIVSTGKTLLNMVYSDNT